MAACVNCGSELGGARFCGTCGQPAAPPAAAWSATDPDTDRIPVVDPEPDYGTVTREALYVATVGTPPPLLPTAPPRPPEEPKRTGLLIAAGLCLVLLVGAAVWFVALRPRPAESADPPADPVPTTVLTSAVPTTGDQPSGGGTTIDTPTEDTDAPVVTTAVTATETAAAQTAAPGTTPGSAAATTPGSTSGSTTQPTTEPAAETTPAEEPDPMGGPRVPITCGNRYIVQVASEADPDRLAARVAEIRAAGQLPPDTKWTTVDESCAIFSAQSNAAVLYVGPFGTPGGGCPARLTSPPDAFIKGTSPETASTYISCLCPADVAALPQLNQVGMTDVWVGELQRVLGSRLNYDIGDVTGNWGVYTEPTAAAVGRFQRAGGLPVTSAVDRATWAALQTAQC